MFWKVLKESELLIENMCSKIVINYAWKPHRRPNTELHKPRHEILCDLRRMPMKHLSERSVGIAEGWGAQGVGLGRPQGRGCRRERSYGHQSWGPKRCLWSEERKAGAGDGGIYDQSRLLSKVIILLCFEATPFLRSSGYLQFGRRLLYLQKKHEMPRRLQNGGMSQLLTLLNGATELDSSPVVRGVPVAGPRWSTHSRISPLQFCPLSSLPHLALLQCIFPSFSHVSVSPFGTFIRRFR